MSSTAVPVPGGGLPIREWESALAELDVHPEDERIDHATELLSLLEDALEAL